MTDATCRLCRAVLTETFVDLGMSPLCESFVSADRLDGPETFYPLHVRICSECLLVQLPRTFREKRSSLITRIFLHIQIHGWNTLGVTPKK
jgi:hypothetical protein